MSRVDHFRTLAARSEFRQKIERSEFLAIAFPISDEPRFFEELTRIEKESFDARHHCWAFRLFADERQRSSDAGEPSGTAGKPILAAIEGADFHDVGVVVVRWFGGVKLGTGGLTRAYRETAAGALRDARTLDRYLYEPFSLFVPFSNVSIVYRLIDPPHVLLMGEEFGDENVYRFDVRFSRAEEFARVLTEHRIRFERG